MGAWQTGGASRHPSGRESMMETIKFCGNPRARVGTSAINAELVFVMAKQRSGAHLDRQGRKG